MQCALDFEYDNQRLSDFGFVIGNFNSPTNLDIVSIGSNITFNAVPMHKGKKRSLTSTQYDECIQANFQICKNPEIYDSMDISEAEYVKLVRWLNRREFLKFRIIDDESENRTVFYYGSFNIKKIIFNDRLYGLELNLQTNSPFGYGKRKIIKLNFSQSEANTNSSQATQKVVYDTSDEIGYIYPYLKITLPNTLPQNTNSELQIRNHSICAVDNQPRVTKITNCFSGEVIEIDNANQIIKSNYSSPTINNNTYHDICDDFNYKFFALSNELNDRVNKISVSLPCEIEISYEPIIKNSPL